MEGGGHWMHTFESTQMRISRTRSVRIVQKFTVFDWQIAHIGRIKGKIKDRIQRVGGFKTWFVYISQIPFLLSPQNLVLLMFVMLNGFENIRDKNKALFFIPICVVFAFFIPIDPRPRYFVSILPFVALLIVINLKEKKPIVTFSSGLLPGDLKYFQLDNSSHVEFGT